MNSNKPKDPKSVYQCKPLRQSKIKQSTYHYLRLQDKVDVMKTCKEAGLILYEFYLSRAGYQDFTFDDDTVAKSLKWTKSKVKKTRLKLTIHRYFLQRKGKLNDGGKMVITYLDRKLIKAVLGESDEAETEDSQLPPAEDVLTKPSTNKPTQPLFTKPDEQAETSHVSQTA
ncbi:MAG: hypothetical protein Q7W55_15180 [Pseudohongiella sp.]|nr:hypothetical protein [Pseudohongiella sp.]